MSKLIQALKELNDRGYQFHHHASRRGYTKAADIGRVEKYNGKFGDGYKVYFGRLNGSTWYTKFAYYIKK